MFTDLTLLEIIKMLLPLIILEMGLKIFCIIKLVRNGARLLPEWVWALLIIIVSTLGPVAFLIFGLRRDE